MPPKRKALVAKNGAKAQGLDNKAKGQAGDLKTAVQKSMSVKLDIKKKPKVVETNSSIVDSICPLAKKAKVYRDKNDGNAAWECMLNQTDIVKNSNKVFEYHNFANR